MAALLLIGLGLYFVFAPSSEPAGAAGGARRAGEPTDPGHPARRQRAGGAARARPRARSPRGSAPGSPARRWRPGSTARSGISTARSRPTPRVAILTERDPDALEVLRHSSAHILATAVRELFPGAGIGFGPPIEDGFYYDFQVDRPFTPEDLERIEAKMAEVAARDYPFVREVVDRAEANRRFADDPLKLERITELGDDETITVYTDGPFQDLCRGPHIPRTGRLKHFKLLHGRRRVLAGRRAPADAPADLRHGLVQEGGARRLPPPAGGGAQARPPAGGRELDLFMFHPSAPGAAFWTERGTTLYNLLVEFVRERQAEAFKEIKTPLHLQQDAVGDLRPLGQVPGEHVPGARTRRRASTTRRSSR